jgi:UDP-N-acetylglucosamine 2-epimerase
MKNLLVIAGTRPEAIKLAPVVAALRAVPGFAVRLCVTAQHREMLDQVLRIFNLTPDYDLDLMSAGQTLPELTSRLFAAMPAVIRDAGPAAVIVQGDTTTVFAGAMCAFYERVPVAHVEAGLRTSDIYAPFPEEVNRRLVGTIATWHFAATDQARANLLREGVAPGAIHVTGNTVIDALHEIAARAPAAPAELAVRPGERLILVTGHRRESFGEGMRNLCTALATIAADYPDVRILYAVHPNPNVVPVVRSMLGNLPNVQLTDPLDYVTFVALMRDAYLVVTDSGGIQEEAPALGKPVLVTREVTERPEAVEAGSARLVGTDVQRIVTAAREILDSPEAYARMARAKSPFGDGRAASRIADVLRRDLL